MDAELEDLLSLPSSPELGDGFEILGVAWTC
jgi:hypothetical protein